MNLILILYFKDQKKIILSKIIIIKLANYLLILCLFRSIFLLFRCIQPLIIMLFCFVVNSNIETNSNRIRGSDEGVSHICYICHCSTSLTSCHFAHLGFSYLSVNLATLQINRALTSLNLKITSLLFQIWSRQINFPKMTFFLNSAS